MTGLLQGGDNSGPGNNPTMNYLGVLNIRNARITQADFSLSKRGAAIERFSYVAIYADGDGFVANGSGAS